MTNIHKAETTAHGHSQPHGLASDNKVKFTLAIGGSSRSSDSVYRKGGEAVCPTPGVGVHIPLPLNLLVGCCDLPMVLRGEASSYDRE